jgi:prolyl-tRNA synthetase
MVIKPWGYGIWERIQRVLDDKIKASGHENAYFPLFIPLSFLEKEAAHVEGFAKECAVVTHHRLEARDGRLIPTGELDEPLVVRPTSETIIGDSFARWVQSYRDLPLLINQWANVVRWEMRPRLFLRTAEFLWQEGHTAHASADEAMRETLMILEMYRSFAEDYLAVPVIPGEKSARERFPGAERTYSIEAMMQDRKALQAGTSHYLGQNFAKASEIRFLDNQGQLQHAYTTSWGVSTRLIGALIMTHGDDDGMRVPPRMAPKQVVLVPVIKQATAKDEVMRYVEALAAELQGVSYNGERVRVHVDARDIQSQDKKWQWVKRGAPLRVEIGPRDIASDSVFVARRDRNENTSMPRAEFVAKLPDLLDDIQKSMFEQARSYRDQNMVSDLKNWADFERFFTPPSQDKPEMHGGFARAKWCGDGACEEKLGDVAVSIRCLPFDQSESAGACVVCGREASTDAIMAKSY